ncbi:MAG TPA: glycosyltransferase, partial [Acidimicrobiales bacterium]|nr:glycosyltransferase [Acidimicrobiales bacterium]
MSVGEGSPAGPDARVVELVARHGRAGVVVDVGCGDGAVAGPLADLGQGYLGVDADPDVLAGLARRGFEALEAEVAEPAGWLDDVVKALDHRPLAAVLVRGVIEALVDPEAFITGLGKLVDQAGPAPLVVSMANLAPLDRRVNLLLGRADHAPAGAFNAARTGAYTPERLAQDLAGAGWREVERADVHLARADRHAPADCVALSPATALGAFLAELTRRADATATIDHVVRAYVPVLLPDRPAPGGAHRGEDDGAPFLSVLVRTQGTRCDTLAETLVSLAAQTCRDFEVLVLAHDVNPGGLGALRGLIGGFGPGPVGGARLIPVRGGGRARPLNAGVAEARGAYVAVLDDDDLAFAHWVASFREVATAHPGRIVRAGVAAVPLGRVTTTPAPAVSALDGTACYPAGFDLLAHLVENASPICGLAIPRSCFSDLGL